MIYWKIEPVGMHGAALVLTDMLTHEVFILQVEDASYMQTFLMQLAEGAKQIASLDRGIAYQTNLEDMRVFVKDFPERF